MCGIAGIIHRNGSSPIGDEMTSMLQAMKHRGPDSTGFALYGAPTEEWVMRVKLADANTPRDFDFDQRLARNRAEVQRRLRAWAPASTAIEELNPDASTCASPTTATTSRRSSTRSRTSRGRRGALARPLAGDRQGPRRRADRRRAATAWTRFQGTHAIGHARMATESDVDISNAHPYWAYPFSDVAVVHNGQLTNYHDWRRRLERNGHRFQSECDSEIIAVYLAERMHDGLSLEDAMRQSMEDLDGVFTYICVTEDALGMAKDELAAKPLVLYESDDVVVLASEEIAIRRIIPARSTPTIPSRAR